MSKECGLGIHDHLLHWSMTKKEERSVGLVMRLTDWDQDKALEFVRIFYWQISTTSGGAEPVLKKMNLIKVRE